MAVASKEELGVSELEVLADAGYSNGEQLSNCEALGITATVPVNRSVNNKGDHFQKSEFSYDPEQDHFVCPAAGEILNYQTHNPKERQYLYARTGCSNCSLQSRCTKADKRWISRHFDEEALARSQSRVTQRPDLMRLRGATVERPFAHLKQIMGLRRFQCWGKEGVKAEMAIAVLGYNLNHIIKEIGVPRLLEMI